MRFSRQLSSILLLAVISSLTGCSVVRSIQGISAIPAHRVPRELLGEKRSDLQEISFSRLRQDQPKRYLLDAKDVLGIYIENVLGNPDEAPPVHFPEDSARPPAIGFPIPIREDGTIDLPLIPQLKVAGLTLTQTTNLIRKEYTEKQKILAPGKDRIIVTLIRRRATRVIVIREDDQTRLANQSGQGQDSLTLKQGIGTIVDLEAYENDLLHALNETGGMPGLNAKNEVLIYRGQFKDGLERDKMLARINNSRSPCEGVLPPPNDRNVTRIPIRFHPSRVPIFKQKDIILNDGDIVMIRSRQHEKYYTGGVLGGGAYLLPRDYDIDILQAIAQANGSFGASGSVLSSTGNRGGLSVGGGIPPSRAIILRKAANGEKIPIRIDLHKALTDSRQRILIQPEDVILVQYTAEEDLFNFALGLFQLNTFANGF